MIAWIEERIEILKKELETGLDREGNKIEEDKLEWRKDWLKKEEESLKNTLTLMNLWKNGELQFDTLGHTFNNMESENGVEDFLTSCFRNVKHNYIEANLEKYIKTGIEPESHVECLRGNGFNIGTLEGRCYECGQSHFEAFYKDGKIYLRKLILGKSWTDPAKLSCEKCLFDNGVKPFDVYIDIPSGEMLLTNIVRGYEFCDEETGKDSAGRSKYSSFYSLNNAKGRQNQAVGYSSVKSIQLSTANGSCEMFSVDDSQEKFMIGNGCYGEEYANPEKPDNLINIGSVCTDWWGYSIVDKDDFVKKNPKALTKSKYQIKDYPKNQYEIKYSENDHPRDAHVIKCKPGRYKFTHSFDCINTDKMVYTTIERIGDCGGELPLNYIGDKNEL